MGDTPDSPSARGDDALWPPLDRAFDRAIDRWRTNRAPLVVLFSGGVDSGLIAWELRHRPQTSLLTAGLAGAPDLTAGRSGGALLGVPWSGAVLTDRALREVQSRCEPDLAGLSVARRALFLALAAVLDAAPVGDVLCGQGADELFLGYAHFAGLDREVALARAEEDLRRLREDDWPRTQRVARRLGRRIHAPYLEPEFVAAAVRVPIGARLPEGQPKAYFRAWARHRGVPAAIADRPKRALQFGTRVAAWSRRQA